MDKGKRLEYGDSLMTHAMLFTGVDIFKNKSTNLSLIDTKMVSNNEYRSGNLSLILIIGYLFKSTF